MRLVPGGGAERRIPENTVVGTVGKRQCGEPWRILQPKNFDKETAAQVPETGRRVKCAYGGVRRNATEGTMTPVFLRKNQEDLKGRLKRARHGAACGGCCGFACC